ncbi:MAG TPA: hypothetical protein VLA19_29150, partial [Herpetosiphonaceae bacterium]|nr:hypothetical protein [Herpetosiphonaceae bacterium]
GRLDDAKKRREEERKATTARRVLSSNASDAAKVEAQAVLDRTPLEQASRAQDLTDLMEKAGRTPTPSNTLSLTRPVDGIGRYGDMAAAVRELEQRHGATAKAADPDLLLRLLEQRERRESFTTPTLPLLPPGGSGAGGASGQTIVVNITATLPDGSTVRGTTTTNVARGNTIADMRLALARQVAARTGG